MARKLTLKHLFEKESYRSMINLLQEFQDKEFRGASGLVLKQFRYVFEKGYKNTKTKNKQIRNNLRDCKKFFGNNLKSLIDRGYIIPECINSKQAVMKHLITLESSVKAINHKGQRYKLKPEFQLGVIKLYNKESIDSYPLDHIQYVFYKYPHRFHTLYGIQTKYITKEDWCTIQKYFQQIDEVLKKIENIYDKKIMQERIKSLDKFLDGTKSDKIKRLIQDRGTLLYLKYPLEEYAEDIIWEQCERSDISISDFLKNADDVMQRRFWSELHFNKDYGFSQDDKDEIEHWWRNNEDIMEPLKPISYARYSWYAHKKGELTSNTELT